MVAHPLFIASPRFVVSDNHVTADLRLLPGTPGPRGTAVMTFQKPGGAFRVVRISTHVTVSTVITVVHQLFGLKNAKRTWIGAGAFGVRPMAIGDPHHAPSHIVPDTLFFDAHEVRVEHLGWDFSINVGAETYTGMITDVEDYSVDLELVDGRGAHFCAEHIRRLLEATDTVAALTPEDDLNDPA